MLGQIVWIFFSSWIPVIVFMLLIRAIVIIPLKAAFGDFK